VRRIAAGLGLDEILSHALVSADDLRRTGYDPGDGHLVRVANPISDLHAIMRPTLAPSLLGALAENVRMRRPDPWLFEVGKTYHYQPDAPLRLGMESAGTGRVEAWHLGIALLGPRAARSIGAVPADADLDDLKGLVEALHDALGAPVPSYAADPDDRRHPHLHPGRAANLVDPGGTPYGSLGEVHPAVAADWGLPGRPVIAALNLPQLLALAQSGRDLAPVSAAQPIDRDLAIVVDEATPIGEVVRIARMSAGPTLVGLRPFDAYRGPQVGEGRVSYALAFRFQPARAGDEKAVEKAMSKVAGSLRHHLGAEIR
jgi:phenylalanyl-tRNA synthetase beta chain